MVLNTIKYSELRAMSRSINNAAIIKFGSYERVSWFAPQEVCARTRSRFSTFVHLSFKVFYVWHERKFAVKDNAQELSFLYDGNMCII